MRGENTRSKGRINYLQQNSLEFIENVYGNRKTECQSTAEFFNVVNGGAFFTNFKLLDQCGEDICVLVERLCGLGYSLRTVHEILSRPSEKKEDVVR